MRGADWSTAGVGVRAGSGEVGQGVCGAWGGCICWHTEC